MRAGGSCTLWAAAVSPKRSIIARLPVKPVH
jgi:hypothetical protein